MHKVKVNPIVKTVGINLAVTIGMHLSQKYILRGVDRVEYELTQRCRARKRAKRPVGFR